MKKSILLFILLSLFLVFGTVAAGAQDKGSLRSRAVRADYPDNRRSVCAMAALLAKPSHGTTVLALVPHAGETPTTG